MMKRKLSTVVMLTALLLLAAMGSLQAAPVQQDGDDADIVAAAERVAEVQASEPTVSDQFSSNDNGWIEDADTLGNGLSIDEDAYFLHIETVLDQPLLAGTADLTAENFLLTVDALPLVVDGYGELGIVFRAGTDQSYLFLVNTDGEYALLKATAGAFDLIVEPTASPLVDLNDEGVIQLGVLAEGKAVALLVNGEVLTTLEDANPLNGQVGVFITQTDTPPLEIAFDNFTLWDLDELADAPKDDITPTGDITSTLEATGTAEITGVVELTGTDEVTGSELSDAGNGTIPPLAEQLDAARDAEPLYYDEFRRDDGDWSLADEDEQTIAYAGRALGVEAHEGETLYFSLNEAIADLALTSYLLEVDATTDSAEGAGSYDVIFNYQDADNYYDFYVVDGSYGLLKRADGELEALLEEAASDVLLVEVDDVNRLGVFVQGTQIVLLINGEIVAQVEDDALMPGAVGLGAELIDEEGSFRVSFDNLELWEVEEMAVAGAEMDAGMDVSERLDEIRSDEPTAASDFRRDDGTWPTGEEDEADLFYAQRAYHIQVSTDALLRHVVETEPQVWGDFLAEVDAVRVEGSGNYGLTFRYTDDEHYYLFSLRDDTFSLRLPGAEGEWQTLIDWTSTDAIIDDLDEVNRLGVLAQGSQITLLINDEVVGQIEDDTFAEGAVGLAVGTFDEDFHEVAFDNLEIWAVEAEADEMGEMGEMGEMVDAEQLAEIRSADSVYYSGFRREEDGWREVEQDTFSTAYVDRTYELTVSEPNHLARMTNSEEMAELGLTNYLIEVDALPIDVLAEDGYGLVVGNEEETYLFAIGAEGYALGRESGDEQEELISGTSSAIEEGVDAVNRLGLLVQDGTITLLINDEAVAVTTVDLTETTAVGFMGLTGDEGGLVVAFDELEIWSLPVEAADAAGS